MSAGVYTAQEVANILNISKAYAYKLISRLNKELEAQGKLYIAGKVSKDYFRERMALEVVSEDHNIQED